MNNFIRFNELVNVSAIKVGKVDEGSSPPTLDQAIANCETYDFNTIFLGTFNKPGISVAKYYPIITASSFGAKVMLYRRTPKDEVYNYIGELDSYLSDSVYDYGVGNKNYYCYRAVTRMFMPDNDGNIKPAGYATYEPKITYDQQEYPMFIRADFNCWTICDIEPFYEEEEEEGQLQIYYKVGDMWNLGINVSEESITHNVGITVNDTLGRFPNLTRSEKKYNTGNFRGYLGNIEHYKYQDPGKISFIDDNKILRTKTETGWWEVEAKDYNDYTELTMENPSGGGYNLTPYSTEKAKLDAWNEFITNDNLKLLRDMKGNVWIIAASEGGSYTLNTTTIRQITEVSFNWVEVADISNASIIQSAKE